MKQLLLVFVALAMGMVLGQDGLKKYTVCVEKPKPPAAAPPGPPAAKPPASPSAN